VGGGDGVRSMSDVTSDTVKLVNVVLGGGVGVGVGAMIEDTGVGGGMNSVVALITDETGVGVLSSDTDETSMDDNGKEINAGSSGRSNSDGMVDGDEMLISSSCIPTPELILDGRGMSSGCVEQISAVVYSVEASVGHISTVTYSVEHISAVSYSDSDGIVGKDS